jgi:hypothetical protein
VARKIVYQTLEDRGNPDVVERDGPFLCDRKNALLGNGFYFWDGFIKNAHWWGDTCKYLNGYMICEAVYDFDEVNCFDLVNNEKHLTLLANAIDAMKDKGLYNNNTTVARIIQFVKEELKIFNYTATRVYGVNSKADNSMFSARAIFDVRRPYQYLDLSPAIQICFYKRTSLNLRNYTIIYPAEYNEDYAV